MRGVGTPEGTRVGIRWYQFDLILVIQQEMDVVLKPRPRVPPSYNGERSLIVRKTIQSFISCRQL